MGVMGGIQTAVATVANNVQSTFVGHSETSENDMVNNVNVNSNANNTNNINQKSPMVMLIALVIWIILFLLVSKWLWNNVLTKLVTVVKPADSVWQLLGLAILSGLLTGN